MIAALAEHYHWPHDYWRRMGWREFRAWLRERNRSIKRQTQRNKSAPESWANRDSDGWWAEQDRLREQMRGR